VVKYAGTKVIAMSGACLAVLFVIKKVVFDQKVLPRLLLERLILPKAKLLVALSEPVAIKSLVF
jgi:hypothetical protein